MRIQRSDPETLLEVGFVVFGVGFFAGFMWLVGGRLLEEARRASGHAEAAPSVATIPAERHQQLSTSAR